MVCILSTRMQAQKTDSAVIGGPAGEQATELATRLGQPAQGLVVAPQRTGAAEIMPLEHAARQVRSLDLRFGGALAAPLAEHLLTFALALRTAAGECPAGRPSPPRAPAAGNVPGPGR